MTMQTTSSVSERALLLLEIIAKADEPPTLNELMSAIQLPKATTHRFVSLLEQLGFVRRAVDGRRYEIGHRLTSLALDGMRHSFALAPRRAILSALVEEIGETCNITMIDGDRLIYLDRVESDWPLQFRLKIGSHVPLHCTASGKIFLAFAPSLRKTLLRSPTVAALHTAYPHYRSADRKCGGYDPQDSGGHRQQRVHGRHGSSRRADLRRTQSPLRHRRRSRADHAAAARTRALVRARPEARRTGDREDTGAYGGLATQRQRGAAASLVTRSLVCRAGLTRRKLKPYRMRRSMIVAGDRACAFAVTPHSGRAMTAGIG